MNPFVVIFMNFYHIYGTIRWKEERFIKNAIFVEKWLLLEAYSKHCQNSKIEY